MDFDLTVSGASSFGILIWFLDIYNPIARVITLSSCFFSMAPQFPSSLRS